MKKVFISSVIQGFGEERRAAESAVKSLGLLPIMAEQFGAQPSTPRHACVEEVRRSDLFLAILGNRYGTETDSGKSPSEEEFDQARDMGLPIFIFIKNCNRDAQQEAFKKRITGYETGYLVCFDSTDGLFRQVTESLSKYGATADVAITASQASSHLQENVRLLSTLPSCDPFICATVIPSDQREAYFSPIELSKPEEKEAFQEAALFGKTAVFSTRRGINVVDQREHLELHQLGVRDEICAALGFYPNGALGYMSCLDSEETRSFNLFEQYVIDESKIGSVLMAFYSYASWFYERINASRRPVFSFYTTVALFNKQGKKLGKRPTLPPNSMTVGWMGENRESPLVIPRQALKIAYAKLRDSKSLSEELMALIVRAYKAGGSYYEP